MLRIAIRKIFITQKYTGSESYLQEIYLTVKIWERYEDLFFSKFWKMEKNALRSKKDRPFSPDFQLKF